MYLQVNDVDNEPEIPEILHRNWSSSWTVIVNPFTSCIVNSVNNEPE